VETVALSVVIRCFCYTKLDYFDFFGNFGSDFVDFFAIILCVSELSRLHQGQLRFKLLVILREGWRCCIMLAVLMMMLKRLASDWIHSGNI